MKGRFQGCAAAVLAFAFVLPCPGGWSTTCTLVGGGVAVTNQQSNSTWTPVSVLFQFAAAAGGTAEVSRVSQGHTFVLATCAFTNVASIVWVPDADFPFAYGEALVIRCSATNGILQVIRKGE